MWYRHPAICLFVASGFIALGYMLGNVLYILVFSYPYVDGMNITQNSAYFTLVTGLFAYFFYFIYVKFYENH